MSEARLQRTREAYAPMVREAASGLFYGCGKHLATPERERISYVQCPVCHPGAFDRLCTLCRGVNGAHAPECGRKPTWVDEEGDALTT